METMKPLIDQLVKMIQDGTNLVKDQLPEVARQILQWQTAKSIACIVLGIALLCITEYCRRLFLHWQLEKPYEEWRVAAVIVSGVGGIAGLVLTIGSMFDLLQILLAPKVYLIEFLKEFMK